MPPFMTAAPTPSLFFNRELSWLAFNQRVLHEAEDDRNPLLERLKFLAIFANNLDEFIMVRVAGVRRQVVAGVQQTPPDGLTPQEQLDALGRKIAELVAAQNACLAELLARLADQGVRLVPMDELSEGERRAMDAYFRREVFPVLTPLVVDPGHPVPAHLEPLDLAGRGDPRPRHRGRAVRAREGAEEPAAVGADRGAHEPVRAARSAGGRAPRSAVPRRRRARLVRLPDHALSAIWRCRSSWTSRRTCWRRSRSRYSSAGSAR